MMPEQEINKEEPERLPCGTCDYYNHTGLYLAKSTFYEYETELCIHPKNMKYSGRAAVPQPTYLFNEDGLCEGHSKRRMKRAKNFKATKSFGRVCDFEGDKDFGHGIDFEGDKDFGRAYNSGEVCSFGEGCDFGEDCEKEKGGKENEDNE